MTPEIWSILAVVLFGMACLASGLAMFRVRGRWGAVAIGARLAGIAALSTLLISAAIVRDEWSPFERWQMALGLVLAMSVVHLVLAWRLGIGSAGPVVDVVALALVIVGGLVFEPSTSLPTCAQRAIPFRVQWALLFLGSGSVLVAGNAGVMLALHKGLMGHGWDLRLPRQTELYDLLIQATILALATLGGGLALGVWWSWQTGGMWTSGDPREGWMALVWLVAAMSLLAGQLDSHRERWVAGLAVVASATVFFGLLALLALQHLLRI